MTESTTSTKDVHTVVINLIEETFGVENVTKSNTFAQLDVDSIGYMEFLSRLEEKFNIDMASEALAPGSTVQDLVNYVGEERRKTVGPIT
ncbi:hypothetical protein BJX99DRAFT_218479 [Aspergillus californicus]